MMDTNTHFNQTTSNLSGKATKSQGHMSRNQHIGRHFPQDTVVFLSKVCIVDLKDAITK